MIDTVNSISVIELYDIQASRLGLSWVAGEQARKHNILPEAAPGYLKKKRGTKLLSGDLRTSEKSLIGYLNLIHPHQIQVLGEVEINYLRSLRDTSLQDALQQLFVESKPACIILADKCKTPTFLKRQSNEHCVPLLASTVSSTRIIDSLHYYLSQLFAEIKTMHGVFMEIMGIGVLMMGPSGIGKSELALALIAKGHRLIADDAPQFSRVAPDIINGTCHKMLRDFLEVRGLGIINVREMYGDNAIKKNKYLKLIINLQRMTDKDLMKFDRLRGSYREQRILDVDIPEISLPVTPGRNMDTLIECAARNHMLRIDGYDPAEIFSKRQQKMIQTK